MLFFLFQYPNVNYLQFFLIREIYEKKLFFSREARGWLRHATEGRSRPREAGRLTLSLSYIMLIILIADYTIIILFSFSISKP
jgi:hypothetical protein